MGEKSAKKELPIFLQFLLFFANFSPIFGILRFVYSVAGRRSRNLKPFPDI